MNRTVLSFLPIFLWYTGLHADVRVLSVGISHYPESSGWNNLNAHNDVELIKDIFPEAMSLEDASATRSAIEAQLRTLVREVAGGDTVIIHFSGHGQQIVTAKSTEEVDGVDEAIVPYDAARHKTAAYNGENHLTDDVFGMSVDAIRRAAGSSGLVIAVIDACHSDSMDRVAEANGEVLRGTDEIFGTESMTDAEISKLREAYHNQEEAMPDTAPDMGDVVYLSACRSDRRNYEIIAEGKGYGSLTYYFCQAYRKVGLRDLQQFLSAVHSGMQSDRTLRYHGQLPAVRNTIGWKAPPEKRPTVAKIPPVVGKSYGDDAPAVIGGIVAAAALIVVTVVLWIARKRKRRR